MIQTFIRGRWIALTHLYARNLINRCREINDLKHHVIQRRFWAEFRTAGTPGVSEGTREIIGGSFWGLWFSLPRGLDLNSLSFSNHVFWRWMRSARSTLIQSRPTSSIYINAHCTSIWSPVSWINLLKCAISPRIRLRATIWASWWTRATTAAETTSAAAALS
jgi:hypothetical protein